MCKFKYYLTNQLLAKRGYTMIVNRKRFCTISLNVVAGGYRRLEQDKKKSNLFSLIDFTQNYIATKKVKTRSRYE